jgi:hypothetical protein
VGEPLPSKHEGLNNPSTAKKKKKKKKKERKKKKSFWAWWLTPVILATWETEIRRIKFGRLEASPGK